MTKLPLAAKREHHDEPPLGDTSPPVQVEGEDNLNEENPTTNNGDQHHGHALVTAIAAKPPTNDQQETTTQTETPLGTVSGARETSETTEGMKSSMMTHNPQKAINHDTDNTMEDGRGNIYTETTPKQTSTSNEDDVYMDNDSNMPPCGQPWQATQEFGEDGSDPESDEPGKEYSMKIQLRIPKGFKRTQWIFLLR